jgi:hypothetical protein
VADNVGYTPGAGAITAADELTYSGDVAKVQVIRQVHVSGAEGSKTLTEIAGVQGTPGGAALTQQKFSISTAHLITAASTNATNVKASAGRLKSVHVFNASDAPRYVKFHNTAGTPTAGTGVVLTVGVQAGVARDVVFPEGGRAFATGIAFTTVTGIADTDANAVALNDASIEVCYE